MKRLALALAVLGAMFLSSLPTQANTFKYAFRIDANSLDPYALAETFTLAFQGLFYEPLIGRGKQLEVVPALATDWNTTAEDTWRFNLRPDVKFHDGSPFTADDVIFSYERAQKEGSDVEYIVADIKEIRKVDDHTIDIVTRVPYPILPQRLTTWYIMSKAWAEKNGAQDPSSVKKDIQNYATTHANGTGPFMIKSRQQDVSTVLVPNPNWWGPVEHNLTEVVFTPIKSDATRVAALLSGEVDMIYPVPIQDVDRVNASSGVHVLQGPEMRIIFLHMDSSRDELLESSVKGKNPLKDVRVRRAIYQAIDTDAIREKVMRGAATPAGIMVAEGVVGYDESLNDRFPHDPEASKALLAEAGYGGGFELGMDCPNDRYVNDEKICLAVVGMLAKVGIKVNLLAQTRSKFFEKIQSRNTSFALMGWQPLTYDAHSPLQAVISTPDKEEGSGTYNVGGYSHPAIDLLTKAIAVEIDQGRRQQLISAALLVHKHDFGHIPLHAQALAWGKKENVDLVQRADDSFDLRWVMVK